MAQRYGFSRISDAQVVRLILALTELGNAEASFSLLDNVVIRITSGSDIPEEWGGLLAENSYLIRSANVFVRDWELNVIYYRGMVFSRSVNGEHWSPSEMPFVDGLEVQGPGLNPSVNGRLALEVISRFVDMMPPLEAVSLSSSSVQRSENILNQMAAAVAEITKQTMVVYASLSDQRAEFEQKLVDEYRHKESLLEKAYEGKLDSIEDREKSLEDRLSKIDDSDNTHSRRALANRMRQIPAAKLNVALLKGSSRSFILPVASAIISAIVLIILASVSAYWLSIYIERRGDAMNSSVLYFLEIRTLLLGGGAAGLVWFALRQLSARYRQVAKWENDLNRFSLDTERASFLVEADLEARKINSQPLPQVVLESFSRGLFRNTGEDDHSQSEGVGAALNAILNRPASLKLATDGVEVVVDKAGIKKARKDIDSGEG